MNHYRQFRPEDFVWDESFREWVLVPTRESNQIWHQWMSENPDKAPSVAQARDIVLALHAQEKKLSESEIRQLIQRTMSHVAASESVAEEKQSVQLRPAFYRRWEFRLVASVVLLIGISAGLWLNSRPGQQLSTPLADNQPPTEQTRPESGRLIDQKNKGNEPMTIQLEDGSRITLSRGSRLSYKEPFDPQKREVTLVGEAFFEVTGNPDRPFLVYTNELVTKVLGTSFWIKAYDKSKEITVRVKTGRVSVFAKSDPDSKEMKNTRELSGVILSPNQKIIFARKEIRMIKTLVEQPHIISTNPAIQKFEFEDRPVSEVLALLQEAYGVAIIYNQELMSACPITATLGSLSLYEKLDVICKAIEARYEIIDGQIVIHGKGC